MTHILLLLAIGPPWPWYAAFYLTYRIWKKRVLNRDYPTN